MRVLRFFIFSRKLIILFWDFSNFNEIWEYGFEISIFFRACGGQIDAFLKEIVDLPLKYPKIFACGAKICVQGFQILWNFPNFETNVLRFSKNFQISSQGFKVLSLKFPNLRQWFWDFSPAALKYAFRVSRFSENFKIYKPMFLRFFKNFQISSQGFKVLSSKFPNLRQWFWDFSPAAQFGQGGF